MQRKPPLTIIKNIKPIPLFEDLKRKREMEQGVPEDPIEPPNISYNPTHFRRHLKSAHDPVWTGKNLCIVCENNSECDLPGHPTKTHCCLYVPKGEDCI